VTVIESDNIFTLYCIDQVNLHVGASTYD